MSNVPQSPLTPGGVPPSPPPAPPKSSGSKTLFWVLGIVLFVIVACFGSCAVLGFYAMHKAKQAGFDSDLMKKNPGLATAKMAAAMNADVEVISSDDNAGTITVRDKKSGKITTMKFDPQKKAMVITDDKGNTTSMTTTGEGSNASMEMKSSEGTVKIGANADKAPAWVPAYPGATLQNTFSATTNGEQSGSYTFTTSDSADKLISFYGDSLKSGGFAVSNLTTSSNGKVGGMVSGEDKANKRTVVISISTESDGTHANVTFAVKP